MASKLDSSGMTDYSDSFEAEELLSSGSSTSELVLQMKTMVLGSPTCPVTQNQRTTQKADKSTDHFKLKGKQLVDSEGESFRGTDFKAAAQKVQMMQSAVTATRKFSNSAEVRDAVFSDWLERKQSKISLRRSLELQAVRQKEEEKRKKEVGETKQGEKAERCAKAVEAWNEEKKVVILSKQKLKVKEMKKLQEKEEEEKSRQKASEEAAQKWREEKTKKLLSAHREKVKKAKEEEERKKEEAIEKEQSSEQAFRVWNEKKKEAVRDQWQREKRKREEETARKRDEAQRRKQESDKLYKSWKNKKEDIIKKNGTLYPHTDTKKSAAWCPARSIKYQYPRAVTETAVHSSGASSVRSASHSSVRSAGSSAAVASRDSRDSSVMSDHEEGQAKLKSIQVCCQTLEYWCTCEDDS